MNCKICGAELSKPGELCNNCMNKLLKEQERKSDKSVIAVVKGKFNFKYEFIRHLESIGIALFMIILLFTLKAFTWAFLAIGLLLVGIIVGAIAIKLRINTKSCTFYATKAVITWGILRKKKKEIPFEEIESISTNITTLQQVMKIGTFVIQKNHLVDRYEYIYSVKNVEDVYKQVISGLGLDDAPPKE